MQDILHDRLFVSISIPAQMAVGTSVFATTHIAFERGGKMQSCKISLEELHKRLV